MPKSIDIIVPKAQLNWKVDQEIKTAITKSKEETHSTSEIGWIIQTLMKDPVFRRHLKAAKEANGTKHQQQP